MEASTNLLPETDSDGKQLINPVYYKNIIVDHINNYIQENNLNIDKINGNTFLAIFTGIYPAVFKPIKPVKNNYKCDIPYTTSNIKSLLHVYVEICLSYSIHPSLYAFSILTGITEEIVKKYVTPAGLTILNIRREMLRNELASDRMGRIVLANNDSSYGLEYEKKNTIERETVKQGLNLTDLPKLSET